MRTYWTAASPRCGLIFDPRGNGHQVIRAGFGLMHDSIFLFYPERWTDSPPFASQVILNNPVGDSFSNPWANQAGGNPFPGMSFFPAGGTFYIIPTYFQPFYKLQWNLNFQRKILRGGI